MMETNPWIEYLNRMSIGEKYMRVAPYLPCGGPDHQPNTPRTCECDGWKNPLNAGGMPAPPSLPSNPDGFSDCAGCKHKISAHGDLLALRQEDIDRKTFLVIQMEKLLSEKNKTEDQARQQQITQRIMQLREQLIHGRAINYDQLNEMLGQNPPFENPVITQILKNFLQIKFGGLQEVVRQNMEKIAVFIVQIMNRPTFLINYHNKIPPPLFERWLRYCSETQPPGQQVVKCRMCDIFGKLMFRLSFRPLKETLAKNKDLYIGSEAPVLMFVRDLEKELMNEQSPIFISPEQLAVYTMKRKMEADAQAQAAAQAAAAGMQSPSFVPQPTIVNNPNMFPAHLPVNMNVSQLTGSNGIPFDLSKMQSPTQMMSIDPPNQITMMHPHTAEKTQMPANGQPLPLGPENGLDVGARDARAKAEERNGVLRFRLIGNDGKPENFVMLIALKNIFSKQLPKMPREYIARLVLDKNHRSCCIIKQGVIVGGICFRPFKTQGFIEIAFCAITSSEQVKGYGTHLMNHLKEFMRREGLYAFVTYADNFAVGYFKKQGFTKEITMPPERWKGYIKDYEGGTLMECVIHPSIEYLSIPKMIKLQREVIYEKIKQISNSHIVHQGLVFEDGKRVPIEKIEGIKEAGYFITNEADRLALIKWLETAMSDIMSHPSAWPFLKPVDPNEVPDYYEVIKNPIDLQTICERLETKQYYISKDIFFADLRRMCENCRTYNSEGTQYYEAACEIEKVINKWASSSAPH